MLALDSFQLFTVLIARCYLLGLLGSLALVTSYPVQATQSVPPTSNANIQLVSQPLDSSSGINTNNNANNANPLAQAVSILLGSNRANNLAIQPNANGASNNNNNVNIQLNGASSGIPLIANGLNNGNPFQLRLIHKDVKNDVIYVDLTPVNYTNHHEPRIEVRYQSRYPFVTIDEKIPNNTVVAAVVVNDEDTGPSGDVDLAIEHGNELGHFKLVSTSITNTIQVNGAPLSRYKVPEYNLTIVARDRGQPPKSSSVNLVIKVNASAPSIHQTGLYSTPEPQPSSKQPINDLMYVGTMLVTIFSVVIFIIIIACALVRRPTVKKGPPPRTTSTMNLRIMPNDHCLCLGLTNL